VPDIATILEVAGVDTRHQQKGKLLCPKCQTYHVTVSHRKGIAKCWACNWTRTEDYVAEPYERNWVSVRDADAAFTSWQCRRSRGHPSYESTCESRRAADSTSRSPSARRCPTSRRSPGVILCTGSIPHESDLPRQQRITRHRMLDHKCTPMLQHLKTQIAVC